MTQVTPLDLAVFGCALLWHLWKRSHGADEADKKWREFVATSSPKEKAPPATGSTNKEYRFLYLDDTATQVVKYVNDRLHTSDARVEIERDFRRDGYAMKIQASGLIGCARLDTLWLSHASNPVEYIAHKATEVVDEMERSMLVEEGA